MKRFRQLLLIATLFLFTGLASATTLTGTVNNPDTTPFNGAIYFTLSSSTTISNITLPSGYVCPGPIYVPNTERVVIKVVNGVLQGSVNLYDSGCTQPAGLVYDVQFVSSTGKVRNQQWYITGTTENIGSIVPVTQNGVMFNVPLLSGGSPGPQGPAGERGETGATGAAATVAVGTVTTGAAGSLATVTNRGTSSDAILDFIIPQGEQGNLSTLNFADGVVPSGTIDGTNKVFTLPQAPNPASSLKLYKNWLRMPSSSYTLSGATITYTAAPASGDSHVADYRY